MFSCDDDDNPVAPFTDNGYNYTDIQVLEHMFGCSGEDCLNLPCGYTEWEDFGTPADNFTDATTDLRMIKMMYWNCGLTLIIPSSIGNLSELTNLDLAGNSIENLPESIGDLTNLVELSLYNNELVSIPESICNLTNLNSTFSSPQPTLWGNNLCEEYHYECISDNSWGDQDQSNCP